MKYIKTLCIVAVVIVLTAVLGGCSDGSNKNTIVGDRLVSVTLHASKMVYNVGDPFDYDSTYVNVRINSPFGGLHTLEEYNLGENPEDFEIIITFDSSVAAEKKFTSIKLRGTDANQYIGNVTVQFEVSIIEA